jgi:hypothetical protein
MCEALNAFDGGLKKNRCVRIGPKGGGWITLTPLDAQPDPPNLTALKTELNAIEGVIHHCTEMEVDRQYVDSHGQSESSQLFGV